MTMTRSCSRTTPAETAEQRGRCPRLEGEYRTPLIWVQKAYWLLDLCLGPDWNGRMTVWDASCGTGNLIRTRPITSLIATTLHSNDLNGAGMAHVPARISRSLDFLSSMHVPDDIAQVLHAANAVLFLNNPPYKTVNEQTFCGRVRRPSGHTNTPVKQAMKAVALNRPGAQLSVQFMYKITEVARSPACATARHRDHDPDLYMAVFMPANVLTGPAYHPFRRYLLRYWTFMDGFMMPAHVFVGVRGAFSIAFAIWRWRSSPGHQKESVEQADDDGGAVAGFDLHLLQPGPGYIDHAGRVLLRPVRNERRLNLWARSCRPRAAAVARTPLTSALTVQLQSRYPAMKQMAADAIGYLHSNGNSVQHNDQLVGLYSSAFAAGHGVVVRPDNFERACAVFAARRLVPRTWSNWLLEYQWPVPGPGWRPWSRDAVVFSLFDRKSSQSSLRSPPVLNQWFWMGRHQIRACACKAVAADLDADSSESDRFVYEWLQQCRADLGPEAERLLQFAEATVLESMSIRNSDAQYGTAAWDAGWYQIRHLMVSAAAPGRARFRQTWTELRGRLADRLLDSVYEFGFLPRSS